MFERGAIKVLVVLLFLGIPGWAAEEVESAEPAMESPHGSFHSAHGHGVMLAKKKKSSRRSPSGEAKAEGTTETSVATNPHGYQVPDTDPHFSVLFDLLLAYQPGKAEFSFLNYHPLLLMEIVPSPQLQFAFEVSSTPRYYELDWQAAKWVQLRLGKIWIPFDDLNPHNTFGGMVNTNRLRLGNVYFLPDIWADLGIGARFSIYDSVDFRLTGDFYIVNGFGNNNSPDPTGTSADYPNFGDTSVQGADINNDKAMGMRFQATFAKLLSVGTSIYTGRWTNNGSEARGITMLGMDAQLRWPRTEFRVGAVTMPTGLIGGGSYGRVGIYAEAVKKFGANDEWKLLARTGYVDTDDRFTDENDVLNVGGGIRYKPGLVQFGLEHYQDIKKVEGKRGYSVTFFRTVIQM